VNVAKGGVNKSWMREMENRQKSSIVITMFTNYRASLHISRRYIAVLITRAR